MQQRKVQCGETDRVLTTWRFLNLGDQTLQISHASRISLMMCAFVHAWRAQQHCEKANAL
jgi:hypothetical protein